jgi:hypothetical protein
MMNEIDVIRTKEQVIRLKLFEKTLCKLLHARVKKTSISTRNRGMEVFDWTLGSLTYHDMT